MNSADKSYWVGFNHVKGIGPVRVKTLLDFFGDLNIAWHAGHDDLRAAGLPEKVLDHFIQYRNTVEPDKILENITRKNIKIFTWQDEGYPRRLKEIEQPPPVLYVRGELLLEDEWAIAIVGTRRVTGYGRQVSNDIAEFLAHNHVTVVSGMARGVDGIAHTAALKAGGRTIAVLGCGVDIIYPPESHHLAEQIIEHGALLSDYPPGTPPDSANFPPRNRIISGLSMATVVTEAGNGSGALITATFAVEQGRDVFAVPGNIFSPQSEGVNNLISQGARPMLNAKDILDTLNIQQIQEHRAARQILPADEVEAAVLRVLSALPKHIDEIRALSGLPIEKVSATLTMLELKGMVFHHGGMQYTSVR